MVLVTYSAETTSVRGPSAFTKEEIECSGAVQWMFRVPSVSAVASFIRLTRLVLTRATDTQQVKRQARFIIASTEHESVPTSRMYICPCGTSCWCLFTPEAFISSRALTLIFYTQLETISASTLCSALLPYPTFRAVSWPSLP
jgi:hypothetical protein